MKGVNEGAGKFVEREEFERGVYSSSKTAIARTSTIISPLRLIERDGKAAPSHIQTNELLGIEAYSSDVQGYSKLSSGFGEESGPRNEKHGRLHDLLGDCPWERNLRERNSSERNLKTQDDSENENENLSLCLIGVESSLFHKHNTPLVSLFARNFCAV